MTKAEDSNFAEYLLHYVGSKTYGMRRLIKEAEVKGAQRTIPFRLLNKLAYGDRILLAEHRKIDQFNQATGEKLDPIQSAVCFGYLRIFGMSHNLPDDIYKEVLANLHVESFSEGGQAETRACGSYTMGGTAYVQEDIKEICAVIEKVCEAKGFPLKGIKFFVRGSVTKFEAPLTLEDVNFTRGLYMKVRLDKTLVPDLDAVNRHARENKRGMVMQLKDYRLNACMTKGSQVEYDRALEDEYREAVKD